MTDQPDRTTFGGALAGRRVAGAARRWQNLDDRLPGLRLWVTIARDDRPAAAGCLERIAVGEHLALLCAPTAAQMLLALHAGATLEQVAAARGSWVTAGDVRQECLNYILSMRRWGQSHPPGTVTADLAREALALLGEELPPELDDAPEGGE